MEAGGPLIHIVGCGPGSRQCITLEALAAVLEAEVLVGPPRLLNLFPEAGGVRIEAQGKLAEVEAAVLAHPGRRMAVVVTGDPGIASLARLVLRRFGREACRVIPGISSVQAAFARLGREWTDACIVSAHGSLPDTPYPALAGETAIAILLGAPGSARWTAGLAESLGSGWRLYLAENLTLPDESVQPLPPAALSMMSDEGLKIAILLQEVP